MTERSGQSGLAAITPSTGARWSLIRPGRRANTAPASVATRDAAAQSQRAGPSSTYASPLPSATWQRSSEQEPMRRTSRTCGSSRATDATWWARTSVR